jgi:flagellar biosynthesis/type III secretory pathway chaperone
MIGNTLIRESRLDIKDPTSVNFADIVQSHCPDAQLATDLRERSLQVQQSNNRNGALLQAMMRLNEQSLAIITGRTEEVTTYQATGQVKKSTLSSRYTQMV